MAKEVFFTINGNTGNAVKSIKELEDEIKRLQKEWKTAEDPFLRNKIGDSLKSAKSELQGFNNSLKEGQSFGQRITSSISEGFTKVGGAIVGAFAVEKVLEFGKACFDAFNEAELNATQLKNALSISGGLNEDFQKLIDLSGELQEISIFSDDDIQKAETTALQYGLLASQVEELIPLVVDYASATSQELGPALDDVIKGINGQGKALEKNNIQIDTTQSKSERLKSILEQLNTVYGGSAEVIAGTTAGSVKQLGNAFDELKEKIGGGLSAFANFFAEAILQSQDFTRAYKQKQQEENNKQLEKDKTFQENYQKAITNETKSQLEARQKKVEGLMKAANEKEKKGYQLQLNAIRNVLKQRNIEEEQSKKEGDAKAADLAAKAEQDRQKRESERLSNEKATIQASEQAYELEWKNKIAAAKDGAEKLQAQADKAEQDAERLAAKAAAKQKEIEGGGPEDKINLAKEELRVINAQKAAADAEYTKNAVAAMRARVDETTQINIDGIKEETKNKVDELEKQLEAAKGNAAEERRINLEITKTKIDGQIKETQAILNSLNEKRKQTGTLTKEEEQQAKDAADKLVQLNKDKNNAITKSDKDAAKEQEDIEKGKLEKRIAAARAAADVINQIIEESNRRAQEDIQNRLNLNEQAKTDRLAQLDAEYQREKEVRGASASLDKKYFNKKKEVEAEYEKQKAKLQLEAWKKDKEAKLKTSIINTALAIGIALASNKPPESYILAAINGAAGLAQTAIILAQQPPKFSRGGILKGPSHSNGGIPLFGSGGQIYGEAEGGEVILTKNVSKSPELLNLASAINYAAGGRRFDRGGIITPITRFANGGIIEQAIGNNFNDLNATLASINQRLAEPPRAFVVEQEITAVQNKNALIERRSKIA